MRGQRAVIGRDLGTKPVWVGLQRIARAVGIATIQNLPKRVDLLYQSLGICWLRFVTSR